jgi:hypothetical protein
VLQVIQSLTNTVQEQGGAQVQAIQINRKTFLAAAQEVMESIAAQREEIAGAVKNQESQIAKRLDQFKVMFEEARDIEIGHQAEVLELARENQKLQRELLVQQRRVAELLERVEDTERQRNSHYQQERRGFLRRLFGT